MCLTRVGKEEKTPVDAGGGWVSRCSVLRRLTYNNTKKAHSIHRMKCERGVEILGSTHDTGPALENRGLYRLIEDLIKRLLEKHNRRHCRRVWRALTEVVLNVTLKKLKTHYVLWTQDR